MRNRLLRAWVRLSQQGEVVAGSLVLRKQRPKSGRWTEITPNLCCITTTTTTTSTSSTTTTSTTAGSSTTTTSTTAGSSTTTTTTTP